MEDRVATALGAPDIKLDELQIWIHGRQDPDAQDYWDGNWLRATAHCGCSGASVWTSGSIIHLSELQQWRTECIKLGETLAGEAVLACMEPELHVSLKASALGHIEMKVSITPDHLNQSHSFRFLIDQSHLPRLVEQCSKVLKVYSVRGQPQASE